MSEKKGKPHLLKSRKLAETLAHDALQELAPETEEPIELASRAFRGAVTARPKAKKGAIGTK